MISVSLVSAMFATMLSLRDWFFLYLAALVACLGCVFRVDKFHPPSKHPPLCILGIVETNLQLASAFAFCIVRSFDRIVDLETFYADGLIFPDYLSRDFLWQNFFL